MMPGLRKLKNSWNNLSSLEKDIARYDNTSFIFKVFFTITIVVILISVLSIVYLIL